MKTKVLLLFVSVITLVNTVHAQEKVSLQELQGTWSLVIMDIPGAMYYNAQTDSLYLTGTEGNVPSGDSILNGKSHVMADVIKEEFKKISFVIDAAGNMYQARDSSKKLGSYDPEKGVIFATDPDNGDKRAMKLSMQDKMLVMKTEEQGVTVTIICKKSN